MIDYIGKNVTELGDRALHEAMVTGSALRIKNDEEGYGHLVRHQSAVRALSKDVDRAMEKAANAMISGMDFAERVNDAYISAQALSTAAMRMALCARMIYEQTTIWPGAAAGMTPMEAILRETAPGVLSEEA